jgi:hypothetical protein
VRSHSTETRQARQNGTIKLCGMRETHRNSGKPAYWPQSDHTASGAEAPDMRIAVLTLRWWSEAGHLRLNAGWATLPALLVVLQLPEHNHGEDEN